MKQRELCFDEFHRKILIRAPLDRVYRAWSTSAGICEWFLRSADYQDPGGTSRESRDLGDI